MIKVVINEYEYQGFLNITVYANYHSIPNYFEACFHFNNKPLIKVFDRYKVLINDTVVQQGIIVQLDLHTSFKSGNKYSIRGVDNTNYLLYNSAGVYHYDSLYGIEGNPVNCSKILDFFNIKHSFEVEDKPLFLQPAVEDTLWSIVKKVAYFTNSVPFSNGNILRFVNKPGRLITYPLQYGTKDTNIYSSNLTFNYNNSIKEVEVFDSNAKSTAVNHSIKNDNIKLYDRNQFDTNNLDKIALKKMQKINYNNISYTCTLQTHSINEEVPLINDLIHILDTSRNIDTNLLVTSFIYEENEKSNKGNQLHLGFVDSSVYSLKPLKGKLSMEYVR